jgi:RNA polymerase sigma-70 factor (ECF subfamily)
LQDASVFLTWLFAIARNALASEVGRRQAQKRSAGQGRRSEADACDPDRAQSPLATPLQAVLDSEKLARVRDVMSELPEQMRRCLHLRVTHDHTYEEVAAIMGLSINTVKVHLHRARQELQKRLEPYFGPMQA